MPTMEETKISIAMIDEILKKLTRSDFCKRPNFGRGVM